MLYSWQKEAAGRIKNKNAILSAPTGSGKTKVAYVWAGLIDENEKNIYNNEQRIIFTAPIKALSNERYLDLKKMGFDVGLETGDFKKNTDANIICCTQEIYTRKYAALPNQKVIIDEFHYISTDPQRARSYIDGIKNTNPKSSPLLKHTGVLLLCR
jgi:superfamily II RNA helicase